MYALGHWAIYLSICKIFCQEQEIDDELEYLILASDGLWDVVSNEHAVAFVKGEVGPEAAARKLTEIAFARGSTDNITCIVVEFHRAK